MVYKGTSPFFSPVMLECQASFILAGYIDDVRNTDNAWIETQIWNFHYDSTMAFSRLHTEV
jgi:hypothetical protein